MNGEQILLLVAALGVVAISLATTLGARQKRPATDANAAAQRTAGNRAQRRKKR